MSTTRTEAPSPDPNEPPGVGQPDEGAEATAPGTDLPASDGGLEAETESPDQPDDAEPGAQDDAALDSEDDEIVLEAVLTPSLAELYADPPPPELRGVYMGTTRYTRTGLHLRANFGAGYLHIFNSSAANLEDQPDFSVENSSVTAVPTYLELWAGAALQRDLALNLVLRVGHAATGRLHSGTHELNLQGGVSTALLGVGLLYHLDPAYGWLVGLAAGFERWQASFDRVAQPQVGGSGIVASVLGGHDWWLGADTAFGILARLDLGAATGDGRAQVGELQLENSDIDFYLQAGVAVSLSYF